MSPVSVVPPAHLRTPLELTTIQGLGGAKTVSYTRKRPSVKERRMAERFPLHIPVIFRWTARKGARRRANGFARDISRAGVFVLTRDSPPVGARIRLDLFLPPLGERAVGMRVEGQGRVVRVEASPLAAEILGFAAKHMKLLLREFEAGV